MMEIITCLQEFLRISSVTGDTQNFEDFIAQQFTNIGYRVTKKLNCVVIQSKTQPDSFCVCAHLDRVGFIKTNTGYEFSTALFNQIVKREVLEKIKTRYISKTVCGEKNSTKISSAEIMTDKLIFKTKEQLPDKSLSLNKDVLHVNKWVTAQLDNAISIATLYTLCVKEKINGTFILSNNEELSQSYKSIIPIIKELNVNKNSIVVLDTGNEVSEDDFMNGSIGINCKEDDLTYNEEFHREILSYLSAFPIHSNTDRSCTELYSITEKSDRQITGISVRIPRKEYHVAEETTTIACLNNFYNIILKLSKYSPQI